VPVAIALAAIILWDAVVRWQEVPAYILPAPSVVAQALVSDWAILWPALLVTLKVTFLALLVSIVGCLVCIAGAWIMKRASSH
jgi:NitT/TauT family transport system permease protein